MVREFKQLMARFTYAKNLTSNARVRHMQKWLKIERVTLDKPLIIMCKKELNKFNKHGNYEPQNKFPVTNSYDY